MSQALYLPRVRSSEVLGGNFDLVTIPKAVARAACIHLLGDGLMEMPCVMDIGPQYTVAVVSH